MGLMFWFRRYLGIDALEMQAHQHKGLQVQILEELKDMKHNIRVTNSAIGQVVGKLNPLLGVPEDDPSRVSVSKELGEAVIKRLKEEAQVLEHYGLIPKGKD